MITRKQLAALRFLIFKSEQDNCMAGIAKKICAVLIKHSRHMSKKVYITLWHDMNNFSDQEISDIAYAFDNLIVGHPSLNEILVAMGSKMSFRFHYGHMHEGKLNTEGMFGHKPTNAPGHEHDRTMPLRYTFWLSTDMTDNGTQIKVTRDKLDAVDLTKPGLYPTLENQGRYH